MIAANDPGTLIVGTGRCGSTLLSDMFRLHPDLVSVSELFSFVTDLGMRIDRAFPAGEIGGAHFWRVLSDPQPRQTLLLANDLAMEEVIYPWDRGGFTAVDLPPIQQALLPHLDPDDPDHLFEKLAVEVPTWPPAQVGEHYRRLFAFLGELTATTDAPRRTWVERSGGSLRIVRRLLTTFPDANVLHLVRDGRDTAISMSRHIGFRMALICAMQAELLAADPFETDDRAEEDDLTDELAAVLPEHFTAADFDAVDLGPALCGHYWSGEIIAGLEELSHLAASQDRLLTVRYEDLLCAPRDAIERVGDFLGLGAATDWVDAASDLVEQRAPRWPTLSAAVGRDLERACRPGFDALAQLGLVWS